jgi:hypothetical protein
MTRRILTFVSLTLAIVIAARGWWFDYSDRVVHGAVALLVACLVVRVPRSAVVTGGVWLVLIAVAWLASPLPSPDVREGTSEAVVLHELGQPVFAGTVAALYAKPVWGYSLPNPHKVRGAANVLVYYRPGGVMYLFVANGRVVAAEMGGS